MLATVIFISATLFRYVCGETLLGNQVGKGFRATDLHWVDNGGQFLKSANGNFVLGFTDVGNARGKFYLCVLLASSNEIIWTANRDVTVGREDELVFQDDGDLVLFGARDLPVWRALTNGTDARVLILMDNGNLVMLDSRNSTVWQSYDHPSDTLIVGQRFNTSMQLVSRKSSTDFSPGLYSLRLRDTLELLVDLGGADGVPYWKLSSDSRSIALSQSARPAYAMLDDPGSLSIYGFDSDSVALSKFVISPSMVGNTSNGLLVLATDGSLRFKSFTTQNQLLADSSFFQTSCELPLRCGPYGVCSSNGQCDCPLQLSPVNPLDGTQGCKVAALDTCKAPQDVEFEDLDSSLSYFGVKYTNSVSANSIADCKSMCEGNCSCNSGFFDADKHACYLAETLRLGSFVLGASDMQTFIKVRKNSGGSNQRISVYLIVGCSLAFIFICVGSFIWWYRRRLRAAKGDPDEEDGFLDTIPGLPTRFTYKDLQAATNGFSKKLGGGGFGSVYEGTLPDKSRVAVKQLESIGQGKKEFRAEVATIGSIHHVNLVRLRGFCSEGTHRLLVYEFLARGSVDKSLFVESHAKMPVDSPAPVLDWETRYNVALGTARGLAYLHEDCRERIIHCDIKPENILLDENYTAKVSDFGLAKLVNREQSHVFTTMRGTRGYLAPEWLLNTAISEKSDVYSFGMVLLELVSGRKNFDPTESSEKWYIPAYAFKQAEVGALNELLDSRLKGYANEEQVVTVVKIALWCIQEEMHVRPSMGKVVQMLEGNVPVLDPPLSSQLAVRLHARMADAVSERDRYSIYSDFNSQELLSASYLSGPR